MHHGSIAVHSAGAGQGSTFTVRLPLAGSMRAQAPATDASRAEPRRAGRRVLVADDNRDAASSLAAVLELLGDTTRVAHDGAEALAIAEDFRPDVALLDIGMPHLDGHDLARRIRAQPWGRDVVLVALTGWGQEEDRRRSQAAGFDRHLVKPVDFDELRKLLDA
jgi:CheY-like chemotaxis protein